MAKIKERADAPLEHELSPTFYSLFYLFYPIVRPPPFFYRISYLLSVQTGTVCAFVKRKNISRQTESKASI